jgi:hypothetical protein
MVQGDLGAFMGLKTDAFDRVLGETEPIRSLCKLDFKGMV